MKKLWTFKAKIIVCTGGLTFMLLSILLWMKGFAPFGTKTLAIMDADIQYLDFFSYYKDVLEGRNSVGYTFGKTLGGSNVAVFSYYLSSPFNFLLVFFKNSQLHNFFNLLVILKITLASITFAYFCVYRFQETLCEKSGAVCILLSIGYGLNQYNLSQASNIMWFDGVYMLPLILLQAYYVVHGKRTYTLSLMVGLAILFNWYSAGIDCIFSVFWFLFEIILMMSEKKTKIKTILKISIRYGVSMILGVMLSAVLFLPTIGALKKSTRGSLHFNELINFSILGEIPSIFQNYTYGGLNSVGNAAIFCGSLAMVLAMAVLFNKKITVKKRVVLGMLMGGVILSLYWYPLFLTFSLFQWVSSYPYRYSYVCIFAVLFLALYEEIQIKDREEVKRIIPISLFWGICLIIMFYIKPVNTRSNVYGTALFMIALSVLWVLKKYFEEKKIIISKIIAVALILAASLDLINNAKILVDKYSIDNDNEYRVYRENQENLISSVKNMDDSFYRISQTSNRGTDEKQLTANYNEALSYNYASISGYTSSPDDNQREFLNNIGYPMSGINMCVTNTSILGADALLGVKYVLSSYDIQGLEKIQSGTDNKAIYYNPYAFPIAFTYTEANKSDSDLNLETGNPFEYQNTLYKQIFGINEDIYTALEYSIVADEDTNTINIELKMPLKANNAVYGVIPWNSQMGASVYVDEQYITDYACWLSPTVFYIPNNGQESCNITVQANSLDFQMDSVLLYTLNLEVLERCAEKSNECKVDDILINNEHIKATILDGKKGEQLFLSVPEDSGWKIKLNGKEATTKLVGNCLYSIELVDGINKVQMDYNVLYLKTGIIISILAFMILIISAIKKRKAK